MQVLYAQPTLVEDLRSAVNSRLDSLVPVGIRGQQRVNEAVRYALLAPGAPRSGARMWLTLAVGQFYIFGRQYAKLLFYASETAYFQGELAHAAYTAAPAVLWPESPAAEAVLNADSVAP